MSTCHKTDSNYSNENFNNQHQSTTTDSGHDEHLRARQVWPITLKRAQLPNSGQLLVATMENIDLKIHKILMTYLWSLSLVTEVGNVLLAENSKLKNDILNMMVKNSQLAQQISQTKKAKSIWDRTKYFQCHSASS